MLQPGILYSPHAFARHVSYVAHELNALRAIRRSLVCGLTGVALCAHSHRKPLPYNTTEVLRDSYRGKQFQSNPPKLGRTMDSYLDRKFKPLQEDKPYLDRIKYAEAEPEKPKLGFYTADYSKRDEFTLTFRTEQYRSILRQEDKHAQRALKQLPAQEQVQRDARAAQEPKKMQVFLYDMVSLLL